MYNNPYFTNYSNAYNPQQTKDRIDSQIAQLQQMKDQIPSTPIQPQMPTNLTQNFQIAPNNQSGIKYANNIEEVSKELVFVDTPFFTKDLSMLWIKNAKGEIKSYELTEIIAKDEKDLLIDSLMAQINELKGMIKNEQHTTNDDEQFSKPSTSKNNGAVGTTTKENKPSSISGVPTSKKKQ